MPEDTTTKTYVFGQGDGTGMNGAWPWLLAGNNGFGGFGGGWGGGILGFFLGLLFGRGGFGGFGGFGGNAGGAAYIGNQLNNDSNTALLMNAITSQGEAGRAATQNLATALGQDFDLVNTAVASVRDGVSRLEASTGMSALQIINSIQSGNASLSRQLCECCCENRLLTTEQGYQAQIRTIEQTNQLGSQADRNTAAITSAIAALQTNITKEFCDVKEREMQSTIGRQAETITQLRGQIDNANQTAAILGTLNPVLSSMQAKIDSVASKQPNTVPVQWPNLTAVNNTPYAGGFYGGWGNGFNGWGYGFGGNSYWG